MSERIAFKAEINQVLDILIHSLYSEREIFLRELISNASDALNRLKLEKLKSQQMVSPAAELAIWLTTDSEAGTLTIRDTGIGMTQEDMVSYLGTIAHSGAKSFIEAMKEMNQGKATETSNDVIGQFGVGFYSVFMIAEEVTVKSRSFKPDEQAAYWTSNGQDAYEVGISDKEERGTEIIIKLKEDAKEFAESYRLRSIIKTHSDFVAFPIYVEEETEEEGESKREFKQANEQTALWREPSRSVDDETYKKFYQQLTFDFQDPLRTIHFTADMPIQFYTLLFVPSRRDYKVFRNQDEYGLKLYARKVLIQDKFKDLLPPYLRFIEGVVDSEDIPLNVSREMVQATPVIQKISKALIGRIANELKTMAEKEADAYKTFYKEFGAHLKEGIASDSDAKERFVDLLRFASTRSEGADDWVSLADYVGRMKDDQEEIYYLLASDFEVASRSSHLEYFKANDLEVLLFTDPLDSFMLMGLSEYQDKQLKNIDDANLDLPEKEAKEEDSEANDSFDALIAKFKSVLAERVEDVRESKVLVDSAVRLVDPLGGAASTMQRVQRLMDRDYSVPKKIVEINRQSSLIQNLTERLKNNADDALVGTVIEQLYDNELVMEGIHPNPAEMIPRIQKLMGEVV